MTSHSENLTQARSQSPEYRTWMAMRQRCYYAKHRMYSRYGGRGIQVCERWRSDFANFLADMGLRTTIAHTIDRIDNDGNYEPGNCRWATRKEQAQHRAPKRWPDPPRKRSERACQQCGVLFMAVVDAKFCHPNCKAAALRARRRAMAA